MPGKPGRSARRNARRKELMKLGRQHLAEKAPKKGKKPRNRRPRIAGGNPTTMGFPGNTDFVSARPKGIIGRFVDSQLDEETSSVLPTRGKEFIHRHCNPCGEMVTFSENSKIPDGALPNSLVMELREVLMVRYPGATTAALPLDGTMWNLTVIHLPAFRTPCLLIAKAGNSEMTASDRELIVQSWNSYGAEPPRFPNWEVLAEDDLWFTSVGWTAMSNIDPPTESGTTTVQQFRICSDGMTIFNNTPDLINQGMVIGAQWPNNEAERNEEATPEVDGYTGSIRARIFVRTVGTNASVSAFSFPIPVDLTTVNVTASNNMATVSSNNISYPWESLDVRVTSIGAGAGNITFTVQASMSYEINGVAVTAGDVLTYTITTTSGNPGARSWTVDITNTMTAIQIYAFTGASRNENVQLVMISPVEMPLVTKFQLPPTSTQTIAQTTPKSVYFSMKEENGCYMVKRVFQPVFNVQNANQRRQIVFTDPSVEERNFSVAPLDVFDLNYGVGVVVMSTIPTSCAPAFKLIRDVEIVAGADSALMPMMKSNKDKIEAALEVCKSMADHHPMMYPETYNILGGLMSLISGVISKVPILGNVVNAVKSVVGGLTKAETVEAPSGASQNRLVSTNVESLMPLVQMLMRQMNIGGAGGYATY